MEKAAILLVFQWEARYLPYLVGKAGAKALFVGYLRGVQGPSLTYYEEQGGLVMQQVGIVLATY